MPKKAISVQISSQLANRLKQILPLALNGTKLITCRRTIEKCSFSTPKGQASHVLRHTFASHYIMNGGNIIAPQKILGHSTINIIMRYAHLSPDFTAEAVKLNPLGQILDNQNKTWL